VKEGCSILKKHAEELKVKFGSAMAEENRDDEVVSIPGLRGRPPKEITLKKPCEHYPIPYGRDY